MKSLSSIVADLAEAFEGANANLEKQHLRFLGDFFTKTDEGLMEAKAVSFSLPGNSEHANQSVEVPLASLVSHSSYRIEKTEIELSVHLPENYHGPDGDLRVELGKKSWFGSPDNLTIKVTLSPGETPAGLTKIIEKVQSASIDAD